MAPTRVIAERIVSDRERNGIPRNRNGWAINDMSAKPFFFVLVVSPNIYLFLVTREHVTIETIREPTL